LPCFVDPGFEAVQHRRQRGLRAQDPGLRLGQADRERDDRIRGDQVRLRPLRYSASLPASFSLQTLPDQGTLTLILKGKDH